MMGDLGASATTFGVAALVVVFLIAFAESGLGLGSFLPGEVVVMAVASLAPQFRDQVVLALVVVAGAWAGDQAGYTIGRLSGRRLRKSRLVARLGVDRWDRSAAMLQRLGSGGVAAGRLTPLVRTLIPVVAGASAMRWRAFASGSLAGCALWTALWVGLGATVGAMTPAISALVTAPAAVAWGAWMAWKRRHRARSESP